MAIIPGGLTGHIQPADVSWNKPFKEAYNELYGEWTATGEKSYTQAGNIRAPNKLQCLEWVKKAWESVSQDIVIKSLRCCGISVKVDGTEDIEIHCIKDGGIAAEAFAEISQRTAALLATDESDSESDDDIDEDEGELEENEAVIEDDATEDDPQVDSNNS